MSNANTSPTSGKHSEKKDENFITKTAYSIRDKVQEITDDVREMTQNLKKGKKDKDRSKSSKSSTSNKKSSSSDSDDEDKQAKPSASKKETGREAEKSNISVAKPSSSTLTTEKKDTRASARTTASSDISSDDLKSSASSSSSKQSNTNTTTKPSTNKAVSTGSNVNTTDESSGKRNTSEQVHISFNDIVTVDDLRNRIDEVIEKAKLIVGGDLGNIPLNIYKHSLTSSTIDSNKNSSVKSNEKQNKIVEKENVNTKKEDEEPMRLDYNEIHTIDDLLRQVNKQPGSRKIILENTPEISDDVEQKSDSHSNTQLTSKLSNENNIDNDNSYEPPKNLLKTSQDPSSLDTSTITASFQDDQIHVNIENIKSLDDDIQNVPVVLDTNNEKDKIQDSEHSNQSEDKSQQITNTSVHSGKQEAPKTKDLRPDEASSETKPTTTGEEKDDNTKAKGGKVLVFDISEPEHGQNEDTKPTPSASTDETEEDANKTVWI